MWEENPSPGAASESSPKNSREESEGVGHHLTGSEESSNSQKMGFEELDRVVRTATLDKAKTALSDDTSSEETSSGDSQVPFPPEFLQPISPRRLFDLKINKPPSNPNPPRSHCQSTRLAMLQHEDLARQINEQQGVSTSRVSPPGPSFQ